MSVSAARERRLLDLAGKLRAILEEKMPGESNYSRNRKTYPIVHLFSIAYADDLAGIESYEAFFIAARVGLPRTHGDMIRRERSLAQYVDIKGEDQTISQDTDERYKVIEASNQASLESQLNEEPGWDLHSFSVAPYPAQPGTTSQKVVIIAVLERQKTTAGISSGD